jgi:Type II secretion system (T2SS), protein E, N-terminal domain
MKLGSWLIARGRISGVQLKRALLDQSFYGGYLSTSLMKLGYLDEQTLGEYLADVFKVPYAAAQKFESIPPEILRIVPPHVAGRHHIFPLAVEGKRLLLAMMDPRNIQALDEVAFMTGLPVEPWVSSEEHLFQALQTYYGIPRPVRETIPVADRVEDIPEMPEPAAVPPPQAIGAEPAFEAASPAPLGETVEDFYFRRDAAPVAVAGHSPAASLPRSILEWREEPSAEESDGFPPASASDAPADPPGAPDAPAPRTDPPVRSPAVNFSPPRPNLTLLPSPAPASLDDAAKRLRESASPEDVFEALVGFCSQRFLRSALFLVQRDQVSGWGGRGEGFDGERVRNTMVSFSVPSIFSYFRTGSDFYFGPVPGLPANRQFYRDLNVDAPDRVLLVPVQIKNRLIAIIYGDNGAVRREEPDIALFRRLAQKAGLALEILILKNKIALL